MSCFMGLIAVVVGTEGPHSSRASLTGSGRNSISVDVVDSGDVDIDSIGGVVVMVSW